MYGGFATIRHHSKRFDVVRHPSGPCGAPNPRAGAEIVPGGGTCRAACDLGGFSFFSRPITFSRKNLMVGGQAWQVGYAMGRRGPPGLGRTWCKPCKSSLTITKARVVVTDRPGLALHFASYSNIYQRSHFAESSPSGASSGSHRAGRLRHQCSSPRAPPQARA